MLLHFRSRFSRERCCTMLWNTNLCWCERHDFRIPQCSNNSPLLSGTCFRQCNGCQPVNSQHGLWRLLWWSEPCSPEAWGGQWALVTFQMKFHCRALVTRWGLRQTLWVIWKKAAQSALYCNEHLSNFVCRMALQSKCRCAQHLSSVSCCSSHISGFRSGRHGLHVAAGCFNQWAQQPALIAFMYAI